MGTGDSFVLLVVLDEDVLGVEFEVGVGEEVLDGFLDLVEEVSLVVGEDFLGVEEFLAGVEFAELEGVYGLDYDAVGDSLAGWEAAAVLLDYVNHIVRIVVVMMRFVLMDELVLAKGDYDSVLEVV
jgi:hypothetical protein